MTEGKSETGEAMVEVELSALLDGELQASRAEELRRRMEDDELLRRRYEELGRVDAALRAAPRPGRTEALRAGFEGRLRAAEAARLRGPGGRPASRRRTSVRALQRDRWSQSGVGALAAAAVILLALWWFVAPEDHSPLETRRQLAETDVPISQEPVLPAEAHASRPSPETEESAGEATQDEPRSEVIVDARPKVESAEPRTREGDARATESRIAEHARPESLSAEEVGDKRARSEIEDAPESIVIAERPAPAPEQTSDGDARAVLPEATDASPTREEQVVAGPEATDVELAIALELELLTDLPVIEHLDLLEVALRAQAEGDAG